MEVLNMLYICKTLIQMFLLYCYVNQAVLKLHDVQLIVIIFHCGHPFRFHVVLPLKLN